MDIQPSFVGSVLSTGGLSPVQPREDRLTQNLSEHSPVSARSKDIRFLRHEGAGRWWVQITDRETGEVIREIPPEKYLEMVATLRRQLGMFLDQKR